MKIWIFVSSLASPPPFTSSHLQSYEIRNKLRFGWRRKKKPMVGMYIKPTYICMYVWNVHNAWDEITHPFDDS